MLKDVATLLIGAGASLWADAPKTVEVLDHLLAYSEPTVIMEDDFTYTGYEFKPPIQRPKDPTRVPAFWVVDRALRARIKSRNYEHVFHAVEELLAYSASNSYYREFNPEESLTLTAFTDPKWDFRQLFSVPLALKMHQQILIAIFELICRASTSLTPPKEFVDFWGALTTQYRVHVFSPNYDDVLEYYVHPKSNLADGFTTPVGAYFGFSPRDFMQAYESADALLCHIHGSVRFGYGSMDPRDTIIVKFQNRGDARESLNYDKMPDGNVSGDLAINSPLISGHRKALKFSSAPFAHYMSAFQWDALHEPRLVIVGYGFNDPHINAILEQFSHRFPTGRRIVHITSARPQDKAMTPLANSVLMYGKTTSYSAGSVGGDQFLESQNVLIFHSGFPLKDSGSAKKIAAFLSGASAK